jgi:hypothetical protein
MMSVIGMFHQLLIGNVFRPIFRGPLTFNISGETIISSSAGAALPRNVEVVLASLRIYSS